MESVSQHPKRGVGSLPLFCAQPLPPPSTSTFSCSMCFLCWRILLTSCTKSGMLLPASTSCMAAYRRQKAPVRPTPELLGGTCLCQGLLHLWKPLSESLPLRGLNVMQPSQLQGPPISQSVLLAPYVAREGACHRNIPLGTPGVGKEAAILNRPSWGLLTLPAVDHNGCVEGALMEVVAVHFLDEAEQVPFAVWEAPAGKEGKSKCC